MRKMLAAALVALTPAAWAQTSWSNDQFSVSTDNFSFVTIVDGSAIVLGLPYPLTLSNPASDQDEPPTFFDLAFAPQPGYALHGETVSFSIEMNVDEFAGPGDLLFNAFGSFAVSANGVSAPGQSSDGGKTTYEESFFVPDPNLVVEASAVTREGLACPAGHAADDCDFGIYLIFLDSEVDLESLTVTPVVSAVPEPDAATLWSAALGALLVAGWARRRQAAQTICLPPEVQASNCAS